MMSYQRNEIIAKWFLGIFILIMLIVFLSMPEKTPKEEIDYVQQNKAMAMRRAGFGGSDASLAKLADSIKAQNEQRRKDRAILGQD